MPVNGEQALKSLDGNLGLLKELAAIFAEDSVEILDDFKDAVVTKDAGKAKLAAHSLKGLTSTFYAASEVEYIATLENAASNEDWSLLSNSSEQLNKIIANLIDEMRREKWLDS